MTSDSSEAPAISVRGLVKRYGKLTAVNNLTLDVARGEILGFLGLNGAGKTTTIRIILDFLRPTAGHASIFGHDCQHDGLRARSQIGYLPAEMGLYSDLTGREVLDFLAGLDGRAVNRERRRDLHDLMRLSNADVRRKLREYSTGMKRKLGIIQAFQADPELLILDEPTEGLDPVMQDAFYHLLAETRRRGKTVFMSSHVLSEVERVCDRIALLRNGELVLLSTVEETRRLAPRRVRVLFDSDVEGPPALPPGHEVIGVAPREWKLRVDGALGPLLKLITVHPVRDVEVAEPGLEEVVMKYYHEGTR